MRARMQSRLPNERMVRVYDAVLEASEPLTTGQLGERTGLPRPERYARRLIDEGVFGRPRSTPIKYAIAENMTLRGERYVDALDRARKDFPAEPKSRDRRHRGDRRSTTASTKRSSKGRSHSRSGPNGGVFPQGAEFLLNVRDLWAFACEAGKGLTVLATSQASKKAFETIKGRNRRTRDQLIADGVLVHASEEDHYRFVGDVTFPTWSAAAVVVTGRAAAGSEWKRIRLGRSAPNP